ncbi:hypothetical protein GWK47_011052 [Chionoecetes opilio]|uniref:Uncharacterized protein n=1 Tax=Chionoecetes opilio TaxID=41210 RepID=A0A8J4XWR8_CHIOP|nr:hypothetical protein GWK47_011052 [Chionoecetes opilio]
MSTPNMYFQLRVRDRTTERGNGENPGDVSSRDLPQLSGSPPRHKASVVGQEAVGQTKSHTSGVPTPRDRSRKAAHQVEDCHSTDEPWSETVASATILTPGRNLSRQMKSRKRARQAEDLSERDNRKADLEVPWRRARQWTATPSVESSRRREPSPSGIERSSIGGREEGTSKLLDVMWKSAHLHPGTTPAENPSTGRFGEIGSPTRRPTHRHPRRP